jgi:hypothetical protein
MWMEVCKVIAVGYVKIVVQHLNLIFWILYHLMQGSYSQTLFE